MGRAVEGSTLMLMVTEFKKIITIAQFDDEGRLCGQVDLDYDAAGWYRQEIKEIEGFEKYVEPEFAARLKRNAAVNALSRMGVEV